MIALKSVLCIYLDMSWDFGEQLSVCLHPSHWELLHARRHMHTDARIQTAVLCLGARKESLPSIPIKMPETTAVI